MQKCRHVQEHKNMTCLFMVLQVYLRPCSFLARENCICEWQHRRLEGGLWPDLRAFERNLVFQLNYIIYYIISSILYLTTRVKCLEECLARCACSVNMDCFYYGEIFGKSTKVLKKGKDEIRVDEIRDHYCSIIPNLRSILRMDWSKEILSTGQCIALIQVSEDEGQE